MTTNGDLQRDILDLTEDIKRPKVRLTEDTEYEMRVPEDFGIVEGAQFQRYGKIIEQIQNGEGELTDAEKAKLQNVLSQLVAMLLPDAPEDVRNSLPIHKQNRLYVFFNKLRPADQDSESTPQPEPSPTSPVSNSSTAATRKRG